METKDTKKKKLLLVILLAVVIAVVAVVAVFFLQSRSVEKSYAVSLENAEKYLAENDYENAILEYKNAIELDPENEQAYMDLADVYLAQDDKSSAITILEKGYLKTKSSAIRAMCDSISLVVENIVETTSSEKEGAEAETVDLTTASEGLTWNTSFLQKLSGYTYTDFVREYGSVTMTNIDSDGYVVVRHSGLEADFYYKNTTTNKNIVNENKGRPNDTAMPEKVIFDDITALFRNFEGCASIDRIETMLGSVATIRTGTNGSYIDYTIADCELCIGTDASGNITSADGWNEVIFPNANQDVEPEGAEVSGEVVDAVTGDGVSGAVVTFVGYEGETTVTTDSNGAFTAEVDGGDYSVVVEADGYVYETFDFSIEAGEKKSGEQFVISPESSGEIRIVLEWGATPTDMDSYLYGSMDSGTSMSVDYTNKTAYENGEIAAQLDLDDTDGYGPETTTIYNLNGVYSFHVHDFTRSTEFGGATVKVYVPGQEVMTITMPSGTYDGDTLAWYVCTIDHGTVTVTNSVEEDGFDGASK